MVAKSLLVKILLRVILPLTVILVIVFSVGYFGTKSVENGGFFPLERPEESIKQVIAEFMEAGATRNIEAAYAYWSPDSATEEEIVEFIESNYEDLFAGYKRFTIESMRWYSGWHQVMVEMRTWASCHAWGEVIYSGGEVLPFHARLLNKNRGSVAVISYRNWKITDIGIG